MRLKDASAQLLVEQIADVVVHAVLPCVARTKGLQRPAWRGARQEGGHVILIILRTRTLSIGLATRIRAGDWYGS